MAAPARRRRAVLLVGHGSRARGFESAMKRVAGKIAAGRDEEVACAYLEIAPPSVPEAIARLAASGAVEIRILPYFLQSGRHVRRDLPKLVRDEARRHRGVRLRLCPYLGYDDRLVAVVKKRLAEAPK
ncbi:MAG TPA: CbiX/SirB N-terminal domain-containing protein [Candidatus Eisenbacteria bacterium]|nr:CbiX/SirB N-terminal domain-containing protein [Candidatus Eisenbacteria bacterium]